MSQVIDYNAPIVPGGNFLWREYARLKDWNAFLNPTETQKRNAIILFGHVQNLIRAPLGRGLIVGSGARNSAYVQYLRSRGIMAAPNGSHVTWEGVDLWPTGGMTVRQLWDFCHARWPGRMERWEHTPGHVHLDTWQWGQRIRFNP